MIERSVETSDLPAPTAPSHPAFQQEAHSVWSSPASGLPRHHDARKVAAVLASRFYATFSPSLARDRLGAPLRCKEAQCRSSDGNRFAGALDIPYCENNLRCEE